MTMRRPVLVALIVSAGLAAVASGLLTTAWVGENLHGDFADQRTGAIDVGFTTTVFLSWFAAFGCAFAVVGMMGVFARALLETHRERSIRP